MTEERKVHGNDRGEEKNTGMTRKVLVMFRLDPGIFLMDCQINFGNDNIIFLCLICYIVAFFAENKSGSINGRQKNLYSH